MANNTFDQSEEYQEGRRGEDIHQEEHQVEGSFTKADTISRANGGISDKQ